MNCEHKEPLWDINCDACCVRKVLAMPDRDRRRQVLVTVRMRRGRGAEERIRKLVEESWGKRSS